MKINAKLSIEADIDPIELGRALIGHAAELADIRDDAGCDWFTYGNCTYIAHARWSGWLVSDDPNVAALVNAGNLLISGKMFILTQEMIEEQIRHEAMMGL